MPGHRQACARGRGQDDVNVPADAGPSPCGRGGQAVGGAGQGDGGIGVCMEAGHRASGFRRLLKAGGRGHGVGSARGPAVRQVLSKQAGPPKGPTPMPDVLWRLRAMLVSASMAWRGRRCGGAGAAHAGQGCPGCPSVRVGRRTTGTRCAPYCVGAASLGKRCGCGVRSSIRRPANTPPPQAGRGRPKGRSRPGRENVPRRRASGPGGGAVRGRCQAGR